MMDQVMIVTGASQGIAESLARPAAANGYAVALTCQTNKAMVATAGLWLLLPEASYITGVILPVSGGR